MKRTIHLLLIMLTCTCALRAAVVTSVLNGDMDGNGILNTADVKILADICNAKLRYQQGHISNGSIVISEASTFTKTSTTYLNGDFNQDGKITILDVAYLVAVLNESKPIQYASIGNGTIIIKNAGGLIFNPEKDEFVDDGEVEF